jgi:hypothetical protein
VNPVVIVLAAGLDQENAAGSIRRQAVGQQASGRTGTHDDGVKNEVLHGERTLKRMRKHLSVPVFSQTPSLGTILLNENGTHRLPVNGISLLIQ